MLIDGTDAVPFSGNVIRSMFGNQHVSVSGDDNTKVQLDTCVLAKFSASLSDISDSDQGRERCGKSKRSRRAMVESVRLVFLFVPFPKRQQSESILRFEALHEPMQPIELSGKFRCRLWAGASAPCFASSTASFKFCVFRCRWVGLSSEYVAEDYPAAR